MVRTEGARSLYNGLVAGLQRQMSFASVRIGLYDSMKQFYTKGSESEYQTVCLNRNRKTEMIIDRLTLCSSLFRSEHCDTPAGWLHHRRHGCHFRTAHRCCKSAFPGSSAPIWWIKKIQWHNGCISDYRPWWGCSGAMEGWAIVHPKKISIIYSPWFHYKPVWISFFGTKKIFWRMLSLFLSTQCKFMGSKPVLLIQLKLKLMQICKWNKTETK